MTRWGTALCLAALACGGDSAIVTEYEAARSAAIADPGPAPTDWQPDGALHFSPALMDSLVTVGLQSYGALQGTSEASGPLGVRGQVTYDMTVRRLDMVSSEECERCVAVSVRVGGDVDYRFGPVRGNTPVRIDIGLVQRLDVSSRPDQSFAVTLVTERVDGVEVQVGNLGGGIRSAVEAELSKWGEEALMARMEPIEMGVFGGADFPLRALTVDATDDGGASIHFLTRSPTPSPVGDVIPKLRRGWQLDVSQQSLLGLAAKAALEQGALSHGVVVQPTGLQMRTGSFDMDLRLWKPEGKGWWRDYTVSGTVELEGANMTLAATSVEETGQSPGAVLADPLAAVGESFILKAIQDGVNQTLPLATVTQASSYRVDLSVRSLMASSQTLIVKGELDVSAAQPSPTEMRRP